MAISKWKKTPLKKLCNKIGDGLHGTPQYDENSDALFINGNNLKNGNILIFEETKKVSNDDYESNYISLNENSLLLSINGTIGSMAFYNNEKVMLGKSAAYLNFKTGINQFYYHYFQLKEVQQYFYNVATGSTIKNLGLKSIQDFEVPNPDDVEWKPIAKILTDLNKKIELNNKINAELEAMAKLIYDYWFVQFDFPDANGKPYKSSGGKMVYNEALKREIPDGWDVFQLSSLLKHNYYSIGKNDSFDEIEYLDTGSLTKNVTENTELINFSQDKVPSRAKRIIQKNDILYSTVRPNLCHYGIIKNPVKNMIASTGFVQLSSKIETISNDFIYTFLTSSWVTERLHQIAALSVSAYPSISPNDILDLNLALPIEHENMERINSKFDTIYSKISLNQKENKKLSELRDWLLPMLMNGQVTVNDSSPSA